MISAFSIWPRSASHPRQVVLKLSADGDVASGIAENRRGLPDDFVQIGRKKLTHAAVGKGQDPACKLRACAHLLLDRLQVLVIGVIGAFPHEQQRRVALNSHEDVVDGMGDPAGEVSYGLHFAGVDTLRLELRAIRNVLVDDKMLPRGQHLDADFAKQAPTVARPNRHGPGAGRQGFEGGRRILLIASLHPAALGRIGEGLLEPGCPVRQIRLVIAEEGRKRRVDILEHPVGVRDRKTEGNMSHQPRGKRRGLSPAPLTARCATPVSCSAPGFLLRCLPVHGVTP